MNRIDLKVWFDCNNHCLFCVQWDKRYKFKPRSKKEIFDKLDKSVASWTYWVVFTWWEPTVHEDLLECVKYAKSIWFKSIQIQTNWRKFSDLDFCKKLLEYWVNEFWPSIHWAKSETHDLLVQSNWARKEVVTWLINLNRLRQKILTNTVITKQNYKELPALVSLLAKFWVHQFQLAFVHILWSADKNKLDIVPKKTDIIPYVHKALDIWKQNKMIWMTEAIPFCFMIWYEWAIAEYNFMPETKVHDAEFTIESYKEYRLKEWKYKWESCKKCKYFSICEWPWKEYLQIYWFDEFKPILKNL